MNTKFTAEYKGMNVVFDIAIGFTDAGYIIYQEIIKSGTKILPYNSEEEILKIKNQTK